MNFSEEEQMTFLESGGEVGLEGTNPSPVELSQSPFCRAWGIHFSFSFP